MQQETLVWMKSMGRNHKPFPSPISDCRRAVIRCDFSGALIDFQIEGATIDLVMNLMNKMVSCIGWSDRVPSGREAMSTAGWLHPPPLPFSLSCSFLRPHIQVIPAESLGLKGSKVSHRSILCHHLLTPLHTLSSRQHKVSREGLSTPCVSTRWYRWSWRKRVRSAEGGRRGVKCGMREGRKAMGLISQNVRCCSNTRTQTQPVESSWKAILQSYI